MFIYQRPVRFEDVDAAQILFFARFFNYSHEAMEAVLDGVPGGHTGLILKRKIGLPAVHVEADFVAPLRFGDVARIAVTVEHIGNSSCRLRYDFTRDETDVKVATIRHVCVVTDLATLRALPIPGDVRAVFATHVG